MDHCTLSSLGIYAGRTTEGRNKMDTAKTRSFFCKIPALFCKQGLLLPLLVAVLLLGGCKTVPILDRNSADKGGLWEQDENTVSRFHHNAIADDGVIGLLYASGRSVLLDGARVKNSAEIKNDALVSTGPQSGARIELKAPASTCMIRIDELNAGRAFADISGCQQSIGTTHAMIQAGNAILHIHVSQQQTEIMVISGVIKVTLRENPVQSIDIKEDQEIIITHDAIGHPRLITQDEIWQRIRWRDDIRLYKTVVDWEKIIAGAVIVGVIAAVILLPRSGSRSGLHRHQRWRY